MPVTLEFSGDQVATFGGVNDNAGVSSTFTGIETPFLATDTIRITIADAVGGVGGYDPVTGEFSPNNDIIYLSFEVIRDGVTYTFSVSAGSKVENSNGGTSKEQGDTFFHTADSIQGPAGSPWDGFDNQLLFSGTTTFTDGVDATLDRLTTTDFNNDGDTLDPGEAGNSNFNIFYGLPCFCAGTLIRTPTGERLVEALEVGDMVVTQDHGPQRIRWIGRRKITSPCRHLWPVRIARGAFGPAGPDQTLEVSPQHRILVEGELCQLLFGVPELLVAAKSLLNDQSVRVARNPVSVEYFHILFDRHEIVWSNGLRSESFYPAGRALSMLDRTTLRELLEIFPELAAPGSGGPKLARTTLRAHEAVLLAEYLFP